MGETPLQLNIYGLIFLLRPKRLLKETEILLEHTVNWMKSSKCNCRAALLISIYFSYIRRLSYKEAE